MVSILQFSNIKILQLSFFRVNVYLLVYKALQFFSVEIQFKHSCLIYTDDLCSDDDNNYGNLASQEIEQVLSDYDVTNTHKAQENKTADEATQIDNNPNENASVW